MADTTKSGKQTAQAGSKKPIEEDTDFFVVSVTKKRRNVEKKMKEIKELESREKSTLNEDQKNKIRGKAECEERLKQYDEIVKMYNAAKKEAGVVVNKVSEMPPNKTVEKSEKSDKTTGQVLLLCRLCDYLKNEQNRDFIAWTLKVKAEDLTALSNLGASIFTLPASSAESLSVLYNASLKKLNYYLDSSLEKTSDGQTYHDLHELVNKIVNSEQYNSVKIMALPTPARQPAEEKKTVSLPVESQIKPVQEKSPVKQAPVEAPAKPVEERKPTPVEEPPKQEEKPKEIPQKSNQEGSSEEEHKERRKNQENRGPRRHQKNDNYRQEDDEGFITFDRKKKGGDDGHRTRYGGKGTGSTQGQKGYSQGGRKPYYNDRSKYSDKPQYEPKKAGESVNE